VRAVPTGLRKGRSHRHDRGRKCVFPQTRRYFLREGGKDNAVTSTGIDVFGVSESVLQQEEFLQKSQTDVSGRREEEGEIISSIEARRIAT